MAVRFACHWWALALRGLAAVLFGLVCFAWPSLALEVLVLCYGAYALVDGGFATVAALQGQEHGASRWALVLQGFLGLAVGSITFLWPGITELSLLYLIAFWALGTGILELIAAIRLRADIQGEWMLALSGILSVLFGLVLVIWPGATALTAIWVIGVYSIIFGVLLAALAFRLRRWCQHARAVKGYQGSRLRRLDRVRDAAC